MNKYGRTSATNSENPPLPEKQVTTLQIISEELVALKMKIGLTDCGIRNKKTRPFAAKVGSQSLESATTLSENSDQLFNPAPKLRLDLDYSAIWARYKCKQRSADPLRTFGKICAKPDFVCPTIFSEISQPFFIMKTQGIPPITVMYRKEYKKQLRVSPRHLGGNSCELAIPHSAI